MRIKLDVPLELQGLISSTGIEILFPFNNPPAQPSQYEVTTEIPHAKITFSSSNDDSALPPNESEAPNAIIKYISCDSREIEEGDLFISLSDDELLAKKYISDARAHGAFAILNCKSDTAELTPFEKLAKYYISTLPQLKEVIAITGSNGKTTTKEFTRLLLSSAYRVHATDGNMNNEIGLPFTVLTAPRNTEALVLEMGMNKRGEISRLSRTVMPTIAVITNIGTAHIGNLGSIEAIKDAKLEVADGLIRGGILISRISDGLKFSRGEEIQHLSYSYQNENAYACLMQTDSGGYRFLIDGHLAPIDFFTDTPHLLENLSVALAVCYYAKMDFANLALSTSKINESLLRYKILQIGDVKIIDDAYNASLESFGAALDVLKRQKSKIRSMLVGDILESGEYSKEIHYQLGRTVGSALDRLYIVGEMAEIIKTGAIDSGLSRESIFIIKDRYNISAIARSVKGLVEVGECILIKGSHQTGLHKFREEFERLMSNGE